MSCDYNYARTYWPLTGGVYSLISFSSHGSPHHSVVFMSSTLFRFDMYTVFTCISRPHLFYVASCSQVPPMSLQVTGLLALTLLNNNPPCVCYIDNISHTHKIYVLCITYMLL